MNLDADSVKNQLTALFNKTDDLRERVTTLEVIVERQENIITSLHGVANQLKEANEHMKKHLALLEQSVKILTESDKTQGEMLLKIERWASRVTVGCVVAYFFLKHTGMISGVLK